MFSPSWLRTGSLVLMCLVFAALGCAGGSKARAKVKGTVKFFDKHLTAGTVAFTNKEGHIGSGNIDFEGNYEVSDAPIGETVVTVKVPSMSGGSMAVGGPKPPPGVPPMQPPGGESKTAAPPIDPKKIISIPAKYGSPDTSGLKFTVEKGENTHNITLSP